MHIVTTGEQRTKSDRYKHGFMEEIVEHQSSLKVKILLWRAATGCLPTKVQLRLKKVAITDTCPVCSAGPEYIVHILVSCSFVRDCWSKVGKTVCEVEPQTFVDWLSGMFDNCNGEQLRVNVMLIRSL